MSEQIDPSQIMQVGTGFMASKTLLSAVELELFTRLQAIGLSFAFPTRTLHIDAWPPARLEAQTDRA